MMLVFLRTLELMLSFTYICVSQTFLDLNLPPAIVNTSIARNKALSTIVDCPVLLANISENLDK